MVSALSVEMISQSVNAATLERAGASESLSSHKKAQKAHHELTMVGDIDY
jgi:hypothetical protein